MASLAFTFVSSKDGMQAVSFNMADTDMTRLYEALKVEYMRADQSQFNAENPDDGYHDPKSVLEGDYTQKNVLERLANDIMFNIISRVHRNETNLALEELGIEPIRILE